MRLPIGRGHDRVHGGPVWRLQLRDQHRLFGATAHDGLFGRDHFARAFVVGCDPLCSGRLDPDGQQARVGDHQRAVVAVTGFPSERLAPAHISVDILQPAAFDHLGNGHLRRRARQPLGQWHGDAVRALGSGRQDGGLGFSQLGHCGFLLLVVGGKEGGDARQQIFVAIGVGPEDHVAIFVPLQIDDLAQEGDCVVACGEAFGLPRGGDRVLFDLMELGRIRRQSWPPIWRSRRPSPCFRRSCAGSPAIGPPRSAASLASAKKVSRGKWFSVP